MVLFFFIIFARFLFGVLMGLRLPVKIKINKIVFRSPQDNVMYKKSSKTVRLRKRGYAAAVLSTALCILAFANCGGDKKDVPSVENVTVRAESEGVGKGETLQFHATVTGTGNPAQTVVWSVVGEHNAATVIDNAGLLSVAYYESNRNMTVRATSTVDNSKYGETTVEIEEYAAPSIESVTVKAAGESVAKGGTLQLHATVTGTGNFAKTVVWSIVSEHAAATVIDDAGLLSVADSESSESLVIQATSTADDSKYGEASIAIEDPWSVAFLNRPKSAKIHIVNSRNVKISNKSFMDMDDVAIVVERCENVEITGNDFSNVTGGIFVLDSKNVKVTWNRFANTGNGIAGSGRSNLIQFNNTFGGYIANNKGKGGNTEDMISIFKSGGTSESDPLIIEHNALEGVNWVSKYGSGIMLGDAGGSHIIARENTCLSPGQVGIGVASGVNIRVTGNIIYGAPRVDSNVGIYVWNQYPTPLEKIEVSGNSIRWYKEDGTENPYWNGEVALGLRNPVTGETSNNYHADIDPNTLKVEL
jgi:parallel beta-helix repeat protein